MLQGPVSMDNGAQFVDGAIRLPGWFSRSAVRPRMFHQATTSAGIFGR